MADQIRIAGVKPYDGEYTFDIEEEPFTTLEWRWLKKISGYLPLTIEDGLKGGDPDLVVAFAAIALRRAGRIEKSQVLEVAEDLSEAPFGSTITMHTDQAVEDDEIPPAATSASGPPEISGGGSSSQTSGPQENFQSLTGLPASPRSATSAHRTSVR